MDITRHHWLSLCTYDDWDLRGQSKDWPRSIVFAFVKPKHSSQYQVVPVKCIFVNIALQFTFTFFNRWISTVWFIVYCCLHLQTAGLARPHVCRFEKHGPTPVCKCRDHVCQVRLKTRPLHSACNEPCRQHRSSVQITKVTLPEMQGTCPYLMCSWEPFHLFWRLPCDGGWSLSTADSVLTVR